MDNIDHYGLDVKILAPVHSQVMTHEETLRYLAPGRFRVQQRCAEHEARDARRVSARLPGVSAARRLSMAMIGIQCWNQLSIAHQWPHARPWQGAARQPGGIEL